MDQRTRNEIQDALRSADRALRLAEEALLREPIDDVQDSRIQNTVAPAEKALSDFLFAAAEEAKVFEEQDPQSFRTHVEPMRADLLRFVLVKQMYQSSPRGSGTVQLDTTDATQTYEKCLQVCTETGINQTELMTPFVERAGFKNWGDVDVTTDLVLMRYETSTAVEAHLDVGQLQGLMRAARKTAGAVDRVQAALREAGVQWNVADDAGNLADTLGVSGVKGQWVVCIPVLEVADTVIGLLAVVEVDYDSEQEGWWDAARLDHNLPSVLLPIIRGKERRVVCQRVEVENLEDWAAKLPGWSGETDTHPTPLVVREAQADDILV